MQACATVMAPSEAAILRGEMGRKWQGGESSKLAMVSHTLRLPAIPSNNTHQAATDSSAGPILLAEGEQEEDWGNSISPFLQCHCSAHLFLKF